MIILSGISFIISILAFLCEIVSTLYTFFCLYIGISSGSSEIDMLFAVLIGFVCFVPTMIALLSSVLPACSENRFLKDGAKFIATCSGIILVLEISVLAVCTNLV